MDFIMVAILTLVVALLVAAYNLIAALRWLEYEQYIYW